MGADGPIASEPVARQARRGGLGGGGDATPQSGLRCPDHLAPHARLRHVLARLRRVERAGAGETPTRRAQTMLNHPFPALFGALAVAAALAGPANAADVTRSLEP